MIRLAQQGLKHMTTKPNTMETVADHTAWAMLFRAMFTVKLVMAGVPVPLAVALAALSV